MTPLMSGFEMNNAQVVAAGGQVAHPHQNGGNAGNYTSGYKIDFRRTQNSSNTGRSKLISSALSCTPKMQKNRVFCQKSMTNDDNP
jgi:hypothetical protein